MIPLFASQCVAHLIDGTAQVTLNDAIRIFSSIGAGLLAAAGTLTALAFWAGSRFQKIDDDIAALRETLNRIL